MAPSLKLLDPQTMWDFVPRKRRTFVFPAPAARFFCQSNAIRGHVHARWLALVAVNLASRPGWGGAGRPRVACRVVVVHPRSLNEWTLRKVISRVISRAVYLEPLELSRPQARCNCLTAAFATLFRADCTGKATESSTGGLEEPPPPPPRCPTWLLSFLSAALLTRTSVCFPGRPRRRPAQRLLLLHQLRSAPCSAPLASSLLSCSRPLASPRRNERERQRRQAAGRAVTGRGSGGVSPLSL